MLFCTRTFGAVLILILGACAPMKTTYYLPSGGDASSVVGGCSGGKSRIEIPLPGAIVLGVSAYPTDANGRTASEIASGGYRIHAEAMKIYLTLQVPVGQSIQFTTSTFLLTSNVNPQGQEVELPRFQFYGQSANTQTRDYSSTDELNGAPGVPALFGTYNVSALYLGEFVTVDAAPSEFQITLPPIVVNGSELKIAPISFALRDEYVMTGICP